MIGMMKWSDGDKTVVKCTDDDNYDTYSGLCIALATKVYGKKYIKQLLEQYEPSDIYKKIIDNKLDSLRATIEKLKY